MLNLLLEMLANNIIYPLIVPGMMAGAIAILFSFFIPQALMQYKLPFLIGGIIAVLFFTFYAGKYSEESKYMLEKAETAAKVAKLEAASGQITVETVVKYMDRVKIVEKVKIQYVEKIKEFTPEIITAFPVPNLTVRLLDSAANGEVPGASSETDGKASPIKIDRVTDSVTDNYLSCRLNSIQLEELQSWVNQQRTLFNK